MSHDRQGILPIAMEQFGLKKFTNFISYLKNSYAHINLKWSSVKHPAWIPCGAGRPITFL